MQVDESNGNVNYTDGNRSPGSNATIQCFTGFLVTQMPSVTVTCNGTSNLWEPGDRCKSKLNRPVLVITMTCIFHISFT